VGSTPTGTTNSIGTIMTTLKDRVRGNVTFTHYFDGSLWYKTEDGFSFPVPVSDIGTATFLASDKAMLFMRYIRKHMELLANA
jgi:hypothetical protein